MTESQIFLFTGKIIWLLLCSAAVASALACLVVAPIMCYRFICRHLWHWVLAKNLVTDGFSEADIRFAMSLTGGLPCDYDKFMDAVKRIKERGEIAKRLRERAAEKDEGAE